MIDDSIVVRSHQHAVAARRAKGEAPTDGIGADDAVTDKSYDADRPIKTIEHFRRVSTRYNKSLTNYRGFVILKRKIVTTTQANCICCIRRMGLDGQYAR